MQIATTRLFSHLQAKCLIKKFSNVKYLCVTSIQIIVYEINFTFISITYSSRTQLNWIACFASRPREHYLLIFTHTVFMSFSVLLTTAPFSWLFIQLDFSCDEWWTIAGSHGQDKEFPWYLLLVNTNDSRKCPPGKRVWGRGTEASGDVHWGESQWNEKSLQSKLNYKELLFIHSYCIDSKVRLGRVKLPST